MPDMRLVLGHVHGELHELPDGGARARAAGQRLDPGDPHRAQGRSTRPRAARWSRSPAAGTTSDDASVLPRAIASRAAFENAMTLDIAMGGSTNTILHILAAAQEAELDFTMRDIDELSRRVPCVCKVAPNGDVPDGGRPPRRRHPRHPRRAAPRRAAATRTCTPCTRATMRRVARHMGHPQRQRVGRGARGLPRRAGVRALGDRVLAVRALGVAGHRRGRGLHPRRRARATPPTAGWRSSTATSPCAAAW